MSTVNNHDNNNENSDLGSVNPRAVDLSQSVTSESSQSTYSNLDSGPTSDNTPNGTPDSSDISTTTPDVPKMITASFPTSDSSRLPNLHVQSGSSNKIRFGVQIPTTHQLIHTSQLNQLKAKAQMYNNLIATLTSSKYEGNTKSDKMLGFAASVVPQCGYSGLSTVTPFIIASVLYNAGIPFDTNHLISSLPSPQKLQSLVTGHAVDTALLTLASINSNPNVYTALDKGNKKGNKNLAKYFCWFDVRKHKVNTYLIDVDCVDENTADTFDGS